MCFPRRGGLGHYNCSRAEWIAAYRSARVRARAGFDPDPSTSGIAWKASLIVAHDRGPYVDALSSSSVANLFVKRLFAADDLNSQAITNT